MTGFSSARLGRVLSAAALFGAVSGTSRAARAEEATVERAVPVAPDRRPEPDTALAFVAGAATLVVGFGVGASLIGSDAGRTSDIAGWMVMQSSFAVAPVVAHGAVSEWGRGLLFAAPPLVTTAGTATVFAVDPKAVRHSQLPEQRTLWALFVVGLFSSAYGIVDATFADERAHRIAVAPVVSAHELGFQVGGTL